jgi:hypothetical protein
MDNIEEIIACKLKILKDTLSMSSLISIDLTSNLTYDRNRSYSMFISFTLVAQSGKILLILFIVACHGKKKIRDRKSLNFSRLQGTVTTTSLLYEPMNRCPSSVATIQIRSDKIT